MVHTFPEGISPKLNVLALLKFELGYYDSAVYHFNHYTSRSHPFDVKSTFVSYLLPKLSLKNSSNTIYLIAGG